MSTAVPWWQASGGSIVNLDIGGGPAMFCVGTRYSLDQVTVYEAGLTVPIVRQIDRNAMVEILEPSEAQRFAHALSTLFATFPTMTIEAP